MATFHVQGSSFQKVQYGSDAQVSPKGEDPRGQKTGSNDLQPEKKGTGHGIRGGRIRQTREPPPMNAPWVAPFTTAHGVLILVLMVVTCRIQKA